MGSDGERREGEVGGEESDDRLSRIEERLGRMERLLEGLRDGGRKPDPEGEGEPLDVEEAQQRLDDVGQRIDETKGNVLGPDKTTADSGERPEAEGDDAAS